MSAIDLAKTFLRLDAAGDAEAVAATPAFWRGRHGLRADDRVLGAVDFETEEDLHASSLELHPEGDEVIVLVSGAIDVVLAGESGERRVPLSPGQAAVVPRGTWHRLVARRPGRLLFLNHRVGMQSRPA